jgi:high-affinity K+ transport system ATPase subunit B
MSLTPVKPQPPPGAEFVECTAPTRMRPVDQAHGSEVRKGASSAVQN